jgi:hypothetical protein
MSHVHHSQRSHGGAAAAPKTFDQIDRNHNGTISARELHQAGSRAVSSFAGADKNGDGKITHREFKAFQAVQGRSGRGDLIAEAESQYMNPNAGMTREQYEAQRAAARQQQAFQMLMANPNMPEADRYMALLSPDQRAQVEAARAGQSAPTPAPAPTGTSISDQQRALFEIMRAAQRENEAYQILKANPNMPAEQAARYLPLLSPEHRAEIEQLRSSAQNPPANNPLQAFQAAIQQVLNLVQSLLRLLSLF